VTAGEGCCDEEQGGKCWQASSGEGHRVEGSGVRCG
jgi:hypothetical protein